MIKVKKLLPVWFTPVEEKDATDPSRFHIKPLSASQMASVIRVSTMEGGDGVMFNAESFIAVAKKSIIGWENILDDDDNQLPFNRVNLELVPFGVLMEIGTQALANSRIGEEERGN